MKINLSKTSKELGQEAAKLTAKYLKEAIKKNGSARLLLSTGASQLDTIEALIAMEIDWSKVEMFHLDEYIDLPVTHPASFQKYLKERFVDVVRPKAAHYVLGEGNIEENIKSLTKEVRKAPIDIGLIGIGQNAHIAFNDPPADFDTKESFLVLHLDERCKMQQVDEGWFKTIEDVPKKAVTMSVHQIMQCEAIISPVPHKEKAEAVRNTLHHEVTNQIPATMLKKHKDYNLFIDENSASLLNIKF